MCACVYVFVWVCSHTTVGISSLEKKLVVYEISIHDLPTAGPPTTTHLMIFLPSAMGTTHGILQNCVLQIQSVVGVS